MKNHPPQPLRLTLEAQIQIDLWCERFELAWQKDLAPQIENFVPAIPEPVRSALIQELIWLDMAFRRKSGETVKVEDYQARFHEIVASGSGTSPAPRASSAKPAQRTENRIEQTEPVIASPAAQATVRLVILSGPHQDEFRLLTGHETLVVGRAADAQWQLTKDPFFSRYHFRIEANAPECRMIDLNSTNGVMIKGHRVTNIELQNGTKIECGKTVFLVEIQSAVAPSDTDTLVLPPAAPKPDAFEIPLAEQYLSPQLVDFEITRELARGAMGVVYHARHRSSGREAALKLIRPGIAAKAEAVQLFLREAVILSQLCHPRIVEYLSLGLHEGQMFLAMEYLPIVDFPTVLRKQSRVKQIRLACGIMCRVLEALQHAHTRDVVHRDIKPSNILVYRLGKRIHVKLADFGLAKNYMNAGFSSISRECEIRGTVGFMAPEQLINCRAAKPACDLYAAGACLYYYLSGELPYDFDGCGSPIGQILNAEPVPLAQRCPDLPRELARLVDRALTREPTERYSSAEHMRKALLKFTEKTGPDGAAPA